MEKTYSRIETAYSLKKYNLVIKLAEKFLSENADEAEAYNYMALAYAESGNIDFAEVNIKKALAISPNEIKYLCTYCQIYLLKKEYDNCIKSANKILLFEPQDEITIYCKASALIYLNKYQQAEKLLKFLLKLAPNSVNSCHYYRTLADIYTNENKIKSAEKFYEKSLELNPQDPTTLNNYGYLIVNCDITPNNLQKALKFFKSSLRIDPINKIVIENYTKCVKTMQTKDLNFNILFKPFSKYKEFINFILATIQIISILFLYSVVTPELLNLLIGLLVTGSILQYYENKNHTQYSRHNIQ